MYHTAMLGQEQLHFNMVKAGLKSDLNTCIQMF